MSSFKGFEPVMHTPDFGRFRQHLARQTDPGAVPLAEFFADTRIIERLLGRRISEVQTGSFYNHEEIDRDTQQFSLRQLVDLRLEFCSTLGLDYLFLDLDLGLPRANIEMVDDEFIKGGKRAWISESAPGLIQNREDFDRFNWPVPSGIDYSMVDYASQVLPEGMKILILPSGGIFEESSWLMSLTNFCLAIYDQSELAQVIVEKIGVLLLSAVETVAQYEQVGGIWLGDDLGYSTGTFISPDWLRKQIFPFYQAQVELAHQHDCVFFLHSCGNLVKIMDDLIELGFDAKHSFEDKIMPVENAYQKWGGRIGIIGGLDMDLMARGSVDAVRKRTREILDVCGPQGGYALGTGNSLADYVSIENFLAMVDEGRIWNEVHFGPG